MNYKQPCIYDDKIEEIVIKNLNHVAIMQDCIASSYHVDLMQRLHGRLAIHDLILIITVSRKNANPPPPFSLSPSLYIKRPPISTLLSHHCPKMSTTYMLLLLFLIGAVALTTPSLAHKFKSLNSNLPPSVENTKGNSISVASEPWNIPSPFDQGQTLTDLPEAEVRHAQDSYKPASEEKKQPDCWGLFPGPPFPAPPST